MQKSDPLEFETKKSGESSTEIIDTFDSQIQFLRERNEELEKRLTKKVSGMSQTEKSLTTKLGETNAINETVEETLRNQISELILEKARISIEVDQANSNSLKYSKQIEALKRTIDKLKVQNNKLSRLTAALIANEKELLLDIQHLRSSCHSTNIIRKESFNARIDAHIKHLEDELNTYRPVFGQNKFRGSRRCVSSPAVDRHTLSNLHYDNAKHELPEILCDAKVSESVHNILVRAESERERALCHLRFVTDERDKLKARLKELSSSSLETRLKLEQKISTLDAALMKLSNEKSASAQEIIRLNDKIGQYEVQIKLLQNEIFRLNKDDATDHRALLKSKYASDELQKAFESTKHTREEMQKLERKNHDYESKLGDARKTIKSMKMEADALKSAIDTLHRDNTNMSLDIKKTAEELKQKMSDLRNKTNEYQELTAKCKNLEAVLSHERKIQKDQQIEIVRLSEELSRSKADYDALCNKYDFLNHERKHFEDNLLNLTKDVQELGSELKVASDERDALKIQLTGQIKETTRREEIISRKEKDRIDLLNQLRLTLDEASKYKSKIQCLEGQISCLKQEILSKSSKISVLEDQIAVLGNDLHSQKTITQSFEVQLASSNTSALQADELLKRTQLDKEYLTNEVIAVRELNAKLQSARDQSSRELAETNVKLEKLKTANFELIAEKNFIQSQLNDNNETLAKLESIISMQRQKQWQSEIREEEKDAEIRLLRERIAASEAKMQSQSKEIGQLRTEIIEVKANNEFLKEQVNRAAVIETPIHSQELALTH